MKPTYGVAVHHSGTNSIKRWHSAFGSLIVRHLDGFGRSISMAFSFDTRYSLVPDRTIDTMERNTCISKTKLERCVCVLVIFVVGRVHFEVYFVLLPVLFLYSNNVDDVVALRRALLCPLLCVATISKSSHCLVLSAIVCVLHLKFEWNEKKKTEQTKKVWENANRIWYRTLTHKGVALLFIIYPIELLTWLTHCQISYSALVCNVDFNEWHDTRAWYANGILKWMLGLLLVMANGSFNECIEMRCEMKE